MFLWLTVGTRRVTSDQYCSLYLTLARGMVSIHYNDGGTKAIQSGGVIIRGKRKWSFRKPIRIESSPEAVKHTAPPIFVALSQGWEQIHTCSLLLQTALLLFLGWSSYSFLFFSSPTLCSVLVFQDEHKIHDCVDIKPSSFEFLVIFVKIWICKNICNLITIKFNIRFAYRFALDIE